MTPPIGPAAPLSSAVTRRRPAGLLALAAAHVFTLTAVVMVVISAVYASLPTA